MKKLSTVFWILAVLLSNVMCAVVGYNYYNMTNAVVNSAPPSVAFFTGIPYVVGIVVCVALAIFFNKKGK